jgi:Xaa-Pro aminopeptidase
LHPPNLLENTCHPWWERYYQSKNYTLMTTPEKRRYKRTPSRTRKKRETDTRAVAEMGHESASPEAVAAPEEPLHDTHSSPESHHEAVHAFSPAIEGSSDAADATHEKRKRRRGGRGRGKGSRQPQEHAPSADEDVEKPSPRKRTSREPKVQAPAVPLAPLEALRQQLKRDGLHGFIIPSQDEYMGEYIPDSAKRLTWLTGFTGSNGLAIVTETEAAFFTDGRYVLQAAREVSAEQFDRFNLAQTSPYEWLEEVMGKEGKVLGFDAWLHTDAMVEKLFDTGCKLRPCEMSPIDAVWKDRPAAPVSPLLVHEYAYTGEYMQSKCERMGAELEANGADALILTSPDSICWLLNIRGNDVPATPFVHARAILHRSGDIMLFIDRRKLSDEIKERMKDDILLIDMQPEEMGEPMAMFFANCREMGTVFQIDPTSAPYWFILQLEKNGLHYVLKPDPCQLAKACKNAVEIVGARNAHLRDGVAVTRFLHALDVHFAKKKPEALTECTAAEELEAFRQEEELYQQPSFATISGFGSNGAIVHYRAIEGTDATLALGNLYLVDSGGQYLDGTTDITRTVAIGKPEAEHIERYTQVLKGHIALARAVFPEGTTGSQLDVLARQYLWHAGVDYDHGTGHGVGSYLSVHEGPQRISKAGNSVALKPGMIISNEPGYYKEGAYGIRIENLITVVPHGALSSEKTAFLRFDTLTCVPFDRNLIDTALLLEEEIAWVDAYHAGVCDALKPLLSKKEGGKETVKWLEAACAPLSGKKKPGRKK